VAESYKEKTFEDFIETYLLVIEKYIQLPESEYNRELAIFPDEVIRFIRDTQPEKWKKLESQLGKDTEKAVIDALVKFLDSDEHHCLDVIRKGFKVYGNKIDLAYFKPAYGLNPRTIELYGKNRLAITRQLHFSRDNDKSIDLVISFNGIPIATAELKNQMTNQSVEDGMEQYRTSRDPREKLFQFKRRALVHFAVDTDQIYMTTKLDGKDTFFLPFNLGYNNGAGNPPIEGKHKTSYLWEQVWQSDSWIDIIARFIHLQEEEKKAGGKIIKKEKMIFPRYHQLDSVRKIEAASRTEGSGYNYLVQHSAGSGKSNSIGWLAHRLYNLHNENDEKIFDAVIVITDRVVLDKQLQSTIYQFEQKQGVVQRIDKSSRQLAEALKSGNSIIVTTLQKFPYITEMAGELPKRKYAVIIDEAHSSQTGESAVKMKKVLSASSLEEVLKKDIKEEMPDYEEEIIRTMLSRQKQPNISFYAFTATPKYKTLQVFGRPGDDGKPLPFHLYSMKQAIQEHFILDVLKHYTTYKTYYRLIKAIPDDPQVDKKKAERALARFMTLHPHNISQKTEVMIEHFNHFTRHKIGGKAKAMVVTDSRAMAISYKLAFDEYIKEKGYHYIKTLVAYSGKITIGEKGSEITYSEEDMNREGKRIIRESELREYFDTDEFNVLIVADKYQTGYDQPLLHTMYVDKRLSGIRAVQTLSRLNRTHPGKEDTFILDFVNDPQEIKESFQPYYEETTIAEDVEPQQLYDIAKKLEKYQVYHTDEVEAFCAIFFKPKVTQTPSDHAKMNAIIDPAVVRYRELAEKDQDIFKKLLMAYKNLYAFLSQIIPFYDSDLEKLYAFIRMFLAKLPRREFGTAYNFDDEVTLKYYRLEKVSEGSIALDEGERGQVSGPVDVGMGKLKVIMKALSEIIDVLNERFGTDFKPADQLFLDQIKEDAKSNENIREKALANSIDNFQLVFAKELMNLFIDRIDQNTSIFNRYSDDKDFQKALTDLMTRDVYQEIREEDKEKKGA
jgi:type I restriction enzyme R subunit